MTQAKQPKAKRATRKRKPEDEVALAWQNFHATTHGRRAIGALMAEFGIYEGSDSVDPYLLAREKGQRDVLMKIAEYVRWKPEEFVPDTQRMNEDLMFPELQQTVDDLVMQYSGVHR